MLHQRTVPALAAATVALLAALTACASEDVAPGGSLEALAERVGCVPAERAGSPELRQANCRTKNGRYVITTFTTDRGQREWINDAKAYGGTYLVGRKWVVSGDVDTVEALRGRLGGTLESGAGHGAHDSRDH
ncbi:hypothetical protein [Streptomyces sp. NPDC050504]|uniref:hypothetical protein n=1 Tax=Streptomyces sp. NPDC050504 TaxID=3365618 RepID=UPI0037AD2347